MTATFIPEGITEPPQKAPFPFPTTTPPDEKISGKASF